MEKEQLKETGSDSWVGVDRDGLSAKEGERACLWVFFKESGWASMFDDDKVGK